MDLVFQFVVQLSVQSLTGNTVDPPNIDKWDIIGSKCIPICLEVFINFFVLEIAAHVSDVLGVFEVRGVDWKPIPSGQGLQANFPVQILTLELVRMKSSVQIHGFCGWSHFASDAVYVVMVVDGIT